jgi:protein-tyrosine phosphatase
MPATDAITAAHTQVQDALRAAGGKLQLGLAAENFWDGVFYERSQAGTIPRYDGGPAFLFEIHPEDLPVRFEDTLFQLHSRGLFPVMAHPERYRPFQDDLDKLAGVGRRCALVVDLGALAGYHGWGVGRVARRILKAGLAHAVASDVHTEGDVRAAAEGIAWIRKKLGDGMARRLLDENPRRILAGELPE